MLQAVEPKPGPGEWPRVRPEDVQELMPDLDQVAEEMIEAIQRGVPEYARPLDDTYRASVRHAVTHAVHEFADRLIDPGAPHDRATQVFRNIGRNEASEGRSLEPLQNALRLGARVAWRRLGQRAAGGAMDSRVLAPVGEAIFLYLDELAGACSRGYAEATAEVAGEMERRRRRLLDLTRLAVRPGQRRTVFTMLAGHYVMLAGLLNAAWVARDAGTAGFPPGPGEA